MTFEEFQEMTINPQRRDVDTIIEGIEYDFKDL